ncbi:Ribosome-associated ATPase [Cellulomonas sp. T2.31MG-18]|uniref:ABC transporter ATP-binding protein n=1 Tax=Cellulomonas sp. T2.31MG-18 TaxID=3157619 RepID=UPI0035F08B24
MRNNEHGGGRPVAVEVRGLRVVRVGNVVLDGLDLTVPAGEVVGLLGPSGSGKTTLMRSIVGAQVVAGGTVTVLGRPAGSPPLRREVAYVTQAPSVYADLTVGENLHYAGSLLGAPESDPARVLDEVGLTGFERRLTGTLSGGELSRVSLAVALLNTPALLVLDEPTVGLDPVLRRDLWSLFGRLRDAGRSLLVSSHVMDEAARCDRLVLMRNGAVLADGTLAELLAETGAADAEGAFLSLVDRANAGDGSVAA